MHHFLICSLINSQLVMDLPVEHGLLLDNLLDLAHAPFTHTSTFAKGWSVPRFVLMLITLFSVKVNQFKCTCFKLFVSAPAVW